MHTISHHLLRRRARARALKLNVDYQRAEAASGRPTTATPYHVPDKPLKRGPWRWRVVR